jgi:H+/Cl- antiporter ClcA
MPAIGLAAGALVLLRGAAGVRQAPVPSAWSRAMAEVTLRPAGRGATPPVRPSRRRVRARRALRYLRGLIASAVAGAAAVGFGRLCDRAAGIHAALAQASPIAGLAVLPIGLVLAAWIARRFAPHAGGGGVAQVIAAADDTRPRRADPRIALRTALIGAVLCLLLFASGASIGPEGPTVLIGAAIATAVVGPRGPGRRALLAAGGGAGLAAAFNTPLAGVVFAAEELTPGLQRRGARVVLLAVAVAAAAAWRMKGDFIYFGEIRIEALGSAWFAAPVAGAAAGLAGGLFAAALKHLAGPRPGALGRWRAQRPLLFSMACAAVAVAAAAAGSTYGTGSPEARDLISGAPGGAAFAGLKWAATLAAVSAGGPGGLLAPVLSVGAGVGAALAGLLPFAARSDVAVLGMAGSLAGVSQSPFTSAVLVMELTREPAMAGPLIVAAVTAQMVSMRVSGRPLYDTLAEKQAWPPSSPEGSA